MRKMTFATDIDEYYLCSNVVYEEYFTSEPPASTLIEISRLDLPEMLVEAQVEAIIEAERLRV